MTPKEMRSEFNLYYNNIGSNQAPGLPDYEISVYITKAQNLVQEELYSALDSNEASKRLLASSIVYETYPTTSRDSRKSHGVDCKFIELNDCRYIINEYVEFGDSAGACLKGRVGDVTPATHDTINSVVANPFKFNNNHCVRLDVDGGVEILYKVRPESYCVTYIKRLKPVFVSTGLKSIDDTECPSNIDDLWDCELSPDIHRKVVELAAKLALQDFKMS